jgi:hypothetical protein
MNASRLFLHAEVCKQFRSSLTSISPRTNEQWEKIAAWSGQTARVRAQTSLFGPMTTAYQNHASVRAPDTWAYQGLRYKRIYSLAGYTNRW